MSKEDRSGALPSPFLSRSLETAYNGESRCSIKLPAGSWLPFLPLLFWQKSLGHLSPSPSPRSARGGIPRPRPSDNVSGGVEFHGVENIKMRVVHLPSLPSHPLLSLFPTRNFGMKYSQFRIYGPRFSRQKLTK